MSIYWAETAPCSSPTLLIATTSTPVENSLKKGHPYAQFSLDSKHTLSVVEKLSFRVVKRLIRNRNPLRWRRPAG